MRHKTIERERERTTHTAAFGVLEREKESERGWVAFFELIGCVFSGQLIIINGLGLKI